MLVSSAMGGGLLMASSSLTVVATFLVLAMVVDVVGEGSLRKKEEVRQTEIA